MSRQRRYHSSPSHSRHFATSHEAVDSVTEARELLKRLAGPGVPAAKDINVIPKLSFDTRAERVETPAPRGEQNLGLALYACMQYKSLDHGLRACGWKEFPNKILGKGGFGSVLLAYKRHDTGVPIVQRNMAAVKVQRLLSAGPFGRINRDNSTLIQTEILVLNSMVHDNILNYYTHFMILPVDENGNAKPDDREVALVLEYANAGDMKKELDRFEKMNSGIEGIPEKFALEYAKQMCDGLMYMHGKRILHNDLHGGNIFLKYKSDKSKVCMIGDFGMAELLSDFPDYNNNQVPHEFRSDIRALISIIGQILAHFTPHNNDPHADSRVSAEAKEFCELGRNPPPTVELLLQHPWFKCPSQVFYASDITDLTPPPADYGSQSASHSSASSVRQEGHEEPVHHQNPPQPEVHGPRQGSGVRRNLSRMSRRVARAAQSLNCFQRRQHHDPDIEMM